MNKRLKKSFISKALSVMLIFSCLTVTATAKENTADAHTKALVKAELDATAGAMCDYIKNKISDDRSAIDCNDLKNYTLILKSGYSDENVTDELLNYVKNLINDKDNPISATYVDFSGNVALSNNYPYIIAFLNEAGENSSDFNGYNFNSALEEAILDETVDVNLYLLQYIVSAVNFNKEAFSEPGKIIEKAYKAVSDSYTTDENGNSGIDYWGVSVDNNGQCLSVIKSLYDTDRDAKEKIDAAIAWTATQFSDKGEIISWGSPNPSSTALAMKVFSEYSDLDNAKKAFNGMASFKSSSIEGVYEAYNYSTGTVEADYLYTTPDALIGLLAYYRAIEGIDTLDVVVPDKNTEPETTETPTAEQATEQEITTTVSETTTAAYKSEAVPPTGDISPVFAVAAILLLSGTIYLGLNKVSD